MNKTERQRRLETYANAYQQLIAAIREFPVEMWQFRPEANSWTIHETIVHITDSEVNSFARCRKAIAEPGAAVMAYDEPTWAKTLNYHQQSTDEALELFKCLRRNTYNLIKNLPDSVWSQTIQHPENGTMTLDDWLTVYDDHVPAHIAQMRQVYEHWAKQHA